MSRITEKQYEELIKLANYQIASHKAVGRIFAEDIVADIFIDNPKTDYLKFKAILPLRVKREISGLVKENKQHSIAKTAICNNCRETLPASHFYKNHKTGRLYVHCIGCRQAAIKVYRKVNRKKLNEYDRNYRKRMTDEQKEKVRGYKRAYRQNVKQRPEKYRQILDASNARHRKLPKAKRKHYHDTYYSKLKNDPVRYAAFLEKCRNKRFLNKAIK